MAGGSHQGGAGAPAESTSTTPTCPAKASRRDHSQTTPRSKAAPLTGETAFSGGRAPPRLRVPPAAVATDELPSTGLTPLASRLRLGAPSFSPLHDGQWQQHQPQAAPPQAPHSAASAAASVGPPYYHTTYHVTANASTAYNPLSAEAAAGYSPSGGAAAVAATGAAAAVAGSVGYQPYAVSQAYGIATTTTQQSHIAAYYAGHQSYLEAAQAAAAAASAAAAAAAAPPAQPLARADPSWPYLPGISVVETTLTPARPPAVAIPPAQAARLAAPVAGASPKALSPTTPQPLQLPASVSPSPSPLQRRPGMPPAAALRVLGPLLTSFEKAEVLGFPEVWFAGRSLNPKIRGSAAIGLPNGGYDDARGDYLAVPGDHVSYRYEILGPLGRGSFGQVVKALDHATGVAVALKIIRNRSRFSRQAATEAGILAALAAADPGGATGVVRMLDSLTFRGHHCITFELLGQNLYEHLRGGGFAGVSTPLARRVAAQVLRTLTFLAGRNLVHCDIKPENILLAGRRDAAPAAVKVIDFGSSCYADARVYTYIQSRFYRAPEVMLGLPYGPPIDVWSLGCVVAELLTGAPLFPGDDEADQLSRVAEVLGPPPRAMLVAGMRAKAFYDVDTGAPAPGGAGRPDSRVRPRQPGTVALRDAMRGRAEPELLDFLGRCLRWDPAERVTPAQALAHPWVTGSSGGAAVAAAATAHLNRAQQHYQGHRQQRLGPLGGAALAAPQQQPWK